MGGVGIFVTVSSYTTFKCRAWARRLRRRTSRRRLPATVWRLASMKHCWCTTSQACRRRGFPASIPRRRSPSVQRISTSRRLNIRGAINVWNPATNRHLASLELQSRKMGQIVWLLVVTDSTHCITSKRDSDLGTRQCQRDDHSLGHQGGIPCAVFHPGGRILATGGKDGLVRFWNPKDGKLLGHD